MVRKSVYLVHNLFGHGKRCPVFVVYTSTRVEADEVVPALGVAIQTSGYRTYSASSHAVVVLFVCLCVLTKFDLAVRIEIESAI